MPLSNDVNKRLVTITVTIKVYADGDIERSVFDNLLSEEVLAKTGETTVSSSIIKDLDLDFSYNEKNYKSAISDLYHQLDDIYKKSDIVDYHNAIDGKSFPVKIYVRDDDNTKVNVGQERTIDVLFVVDIDEFLAAINRLESINDYTYYLTKNYWTFVCISDSIFI